MAKKFFKKKGYKSRSRRRSKRGRSMGKIYKNNILDRSLTRCIELTLPIYMRPPGTAVAVTSTAPAMSLTEPSFVGSTTATSSDLGSALTASLEFARLATSWSLFRVKGVGIKYFSNQISTDSTTTNLGISSLCVTSKLSTNNTAGLNANYIIDNAFRFSMGGTSPNGSKSRYFSLPSRSLVIRSSGGANNPVNTWLSTAIGAGFTEALMLNLGSPLATATNPNHVILTANVNNVYVVGRVSVKFYCQFSQTNYT